MSFVDVLAHPCILRRRAARNRPAEIEQLAATYRLYQAGTHTLYPVEQLPATRTLRGECIRIEDVETHINGAVISFAVLETPILNEQGMVEYAIVAFQDITVQKRAEQILAGYSRELEQEVSQRIAELAQMNEQLQQEIQERELAEQKLQIANQGLEQLATMDELTQVANRRYLGQWLQQEWQRAKRNQSQLSLILFDVDYFKYYNDRYGHQAGDYCLVQVAQAAKEVVNRPADLVARYGGEEFAVILPNTEPQGAIIIAQQIQQVLRAKAIPHEQSEVSKVVTISLGIVSLVPTSEGSPDTLIALADQALYAAKRQGRDRYSVYAGSTDV